jgi:hypothetical protein
VIKPFAFLVAIAALSACDSASSDYSGSYVGGDELVIMQLNIVDGEGGRISGNLAVSALDYSAGKVKLTTRPINGIRNGERFSLLAEGGGWGVKDAPLSLQADGNSLLLQVPGNGQTLELQRMDQEQYRQRLTKFAQALNANDVGMLPED